MRCASSVVVVCGLSCPAACGILVPGPGIEPTSPAAESGFFTTGPPGKSQVNGNLTLYSLTFFIYKGIKELWQGLKPSSKKIKHVPSVSFLRSRFSTISCGLHSLSHFTLNILHSPFSCHLSGRAYSTPCLSTSAACFPQRLR